jgi:ribonuclease HI
MTTATIFIDGGSRGNPGLAAFAYIINQPNHPLVEFSDIIPHATNNVAEYTALIEALRRSSQLKIPQLTIHSDSELMVKQMNGLYRVKHPDLLPLYEEACQLRKGFHQVVINHIRRESNKRADQLCNQIMDAYEKKSNPNAGNVSPAKASTPSQKVAISDNRVRIEALTCLESAAKSWAANGPNHPRVDLVWDQLWSLLEENGLLKVVKKST